MGLVVFFSFSRVHRVTIFEEKVDLIHIKKYKKVELGFGTGRDIRSIPRHNMLNKLL